MGQLRLGNALLWLFLVLLTLSCGNDSKKSSPNGPDDGGTSHAVIINGTVTSTNGTPVIDASIAFADESNEKVNFSSTTDNNGQYEIETPADLDLTNTKFSLTIECDEYIPYFLNDLTITAGNKYDYTVPRENDPIKVALVHDADNPVACIITNEEGNSFQLIADKNEDGSINKITGSMYVADDGTAFTTLFGNDGLPSTAFVGDWTYNFSNYTDTTVDFSMISPDGKTFHVEGIQVDAAKLALLKHEISEGDFATSLGLNTGAAKPANWFFNDTVEGGIKGAALGVSIAGCLASLGVTVLSAGAAAPVAALACGSMFLSAVSFGDWVANGDGIMGKVGEGQGVSTASFVLTTDLIEHSGSTALSGIGLLTEAGALVYENAREKHEQNTTYTVLGRIVEGETGLAGIPVHITGDTFDETITTNSFGAFSLSTLKNGTYTVTPADESYMYSPPNVVIIIDDDDYAISQNIAATLKTFTISGSVLESGSGLSGVTITMDSETTTTGSDGSYSFTDVADGSYTLAFTKSSYVFSSSTKDVTVSGADVTVETITGEEYIAGEPPDLLSFELSPSSPSVKPGESFTARFQIENPNSVPMAVNLDVIWRDSSGVYGEFDPVTYSATIEPGTAWYERSCTVPDGLGEGSYSVAWLLLDTDNSLIEESGYIDNAVSVQSSGGGGGGTPGDTTVIEGITFVTIPSGSFRMGDIQGGGYSNELPIHDVTISSFEMGVYEVTQEQYQSVMGSNPSRFSGTNLPVEQVSWYDAVRFCNALSVEAGLTPCYDESSWSCDFSADGFRLPTEAEWEYACRAGTETKYYTGNADSDLGEAGWYSSNSSSTTHPVGQKTVNAFGLYDMHGNVYEWCSDWYGSYPNGSADNPTGAHTGSSRVIRGGGWNIYAGYCRSASRSRNDPSRAYSYFGFRVVRRP